MYRRRLIYACVHIHMSVSIYLHLANVYECTRVHIFAHIHTGVNARRRVLSPSGVICSTTGEEEEEGGGGKVYSKLTP